MATEDLSDEWIKRAIEKYSNKSKFNDENIAIVGERAAKIINTIHLLINELDNLKESTKSDKYRLQESFDQYMMYKELLESKKAHEA